MLKIAVCDDNPLHLKRTADLVQNELSSWELEIELFSVADHFMKLIEEDNYKPDIAILDVQLGGESGIERAKRLNSLVPECKIIFLTGFADFAPASYEARHVWFVLKSSAEKFLGPALHRALELSEHESSVVGIAVRTGRRSFFLPLGDILYIERYARKTRIICKTADYLVSASPASVIGKRSAPYFIRCHQGYWVNLRQIKALERDEFVLSDGTRIPISRGFREVARSRFFEELSR